MSTPQIVMENDSARVRRTDAVTSSEAADRNDIQGSQTAVMLTLASNGPLADHELVQRIPFYSPSRVRTARHELEVQGLVVFLGTYRLTPTKSRARVWSLT